MPLASGECLARLLKSAKIAISPPCLPFTVDQPLIGPNPQPAIRVGVLRIDIQHLNAWLDAQDDLPRRRSRTE
ncbi:hypothetical protein CCR95_21025 [Thiocystis minor]|uniref:hypothetical protein n=1 Tax=Thiocystis minor TaxID=61597 RepID=UPI0019146A76|nr:hypothetical protein [Thiocystis minor]MBK5966488.1 hypothetical protein [Thiocystis minor]